MKSEFCLVMPFDLEDVDIAYSGYVEQFRGENFDF